MRDKDALPMRFDAMTRRCLRHQEAACPSCLTYSLNDVLDALDAARAEVEKWQGMASTWERFAETQRARAQKAEAEVESLRALSTPSERPRGDLSKLLGKWPGDETDEQVEAAMVERRPEPAVERQLEHARQLTDEAGRTLREFGEKRGIRIGGPAPERTPEAWELYQGSRVAHLAAESGDSLCGLPLARQLNRDRHGEPICRKCVPARPATEPTKP